MFDTLSKLNRLLFQGVAWLTLVMAVLGCAIVLLRYGFAFGSIAMQELQLYLHALVFLLAAAHTLRVDGHVRVDIFYSRWPARRRALVNLAGTLGLLLPFALFVAIISFDYVRLSWARGEVSAESGGLPAVFLLKSLMLVFAAQMALQALVQARDHWREYRGAA